MPPTRSKSTAKRPRKKLPHAARSPSVPDAQHKVLLVDNDQILVKVLSMKFEREGLSVTVCHDGIEALKLMRTEKFHAIVLDLMMPGKNGYDVLEERRNTMNADTPMFVMSGVASPDAASRCEALGATKFFLKFRLPLREVIRQIAEEVLQS